MGLKWWWRGGKGCVCCVGLVKVVEGKGLLLFNQ